MNCEKGVQNKLEKNGFIGIRKNETYNEGKKENIFSKCINKYIQTALQRHNKKGEEPVAFVRIPSEMEIEVFEKIIFPEICKCNMYPWVMTFYFENSSVINDIKVEDIIKVFYALSKFTLDIRFPLYDEGGQIAHIFDECSVIPYEEGEFMVSLYILKDFYLSCHAVKQEIK